MAMGYTCNLVPEPSLPPALHHVHYVQCMCVDVGYVGMCGCGVWGDVWVWGMGGCVGVGYVGMCGCEVCGDVWVWGMWRCVGVCGCGVCGGLGCMGVYRDV